MQTHVYIALDSWFLVIKWKFAKNLKVIVVKYSVLSWQKNGILTLSGSDTVTKTSI